MFPKQYYGDIELLDFSKKLDYIFEGYYNPYIEILNESLFDINEDISYIWESGVINLLTKYQNSPETIYNFIKDENEVYIKTISSNELPSKISQEAHKQNPITIQIGYFKKSSYYPNDKLINLSLDWEAIGALGPVGLNNLTYLSKIYPTIEKEFSETNLKSLISHEIAHWLSDTFHDQRLTKYLEKYKSLKKSKKYIPFKDDMNFHINSFPEIDAIMHSINTIKSSVSEQEWNKMSFRDISNHDPSINRIFDIMKKHPDYKLFVKRFFSRMAREKLLGDNIKI